MWASYVGVAVGTLVLLSALWGILRGIFKQTAATDNNTAAVKENTSSIERLFNLFNGHETRIAILEDWRKHSDITRH